MDFIFLQYILRSVGVNLLKSDKPVSKVCNFKNDLEKFVKIKSIHNGNGIRIFKACKIFYQVCR